VLTVHIPRRADGQGSRYIASILVKKNEKWANKPLGKYKIKRGGGRSFRSVLFLRAGPLAIAITIVYV
jgi:hypothetical protein